MRTTAIHFGITLLLLALATGRSDAAELQSVDVTRADKRYSVVAKMLVKAPRAHAFAALVDYDRFHELSDSYVESRYPPATDDGTARVFTRIEGCLMWFCRGIERHARLQASASDLIIATVEREAARAREFY